MSSLTTNSSFRGLGAAIIILAIAVVAWAVLTMPDQRSTGQKVGDAIDALPQGVDKAARQLENRSPGEKLGDAVKDAGDDIKNRTNR